MSDPLTELQRIFIGDHSPWFFLEVVFRTVFIFVYTLTLVRWMGKRGMGQLSPFELAIIIALGSAVGDPMIYDDVPLINSMIAIAVIIGLQQLLGVLTMKHAAVEAFVESRTEMLVEHGCIDLDQLARERLSKNELFEMLRIEGISQLGEVRQAFIEPSGRLSVIRWHPARAGLSVMPCKCESQQFYEPLDHEWQCCAQCGTTRHSSNLKTFQCSQCGSYESCPAASSGIASSGTASSGTDE